MEKEGSNKKWYRKPRNIIIVLVLVAILFFVFKGRKGTTLKDTASVSKGEVKEELVLSGELKATQNANLQFSSSGNLSWVNVKVGDSIKKGQALMKLDTVILNSAYQQALATLHAAEANVNDVHDQLKNKDSTETYSDVNTRVVAEVTHDKAYDAMVSARKALTDATLVSPFDGLVTAVTNETPGVNITAATSQVTVVNPSSLYFSVNADQTEVSKIHIGDSAEIILDAFSDKPINAKVTQISFTPSALDSGTVYPMRLTLSVDNSDYKYKVGMTGDVRFVLSKKEDALFLPVKFVKSDKNGKYVYIDEKSTKKYIEIGIEGEDREEVKGLDEGTVVYN